jgi:hypothetical protein
MTRTWPLRFKFGPSSPSGAGDGFQYRDTDSTRPPQMHAAQMADELSEREQALRRLPLPYSLALRLRDAGVAADVICQYVNIERAALDGLYRIAEAKLLAAQKTPAATTSD